MAAQARARTRVSELRCTGSVLEWKGRFGWIEPDDPIDHPEACKHGWKIYVSEKDVDAGTELHGGERVSFLAYADGNGVGAEDVRVDGDAAAAFGAAPSAYDWAPVGGHGGGSLLRPRAAAGPTGPPLGRPLLRPRAGGKAGAKGGRKAGGGVLQGGGGGGVWRSIDKPPPAGLVPAASTKGTFKGAIGGFPKGKCGAAKGGCKSACGAGRAAKGKGGGAPRSLVLSPGPGGGGAKREKTSHQGAGKVLSWASSEMQGWRPAMEDQSIALLDLEAPLASHALFGVFDGHGGAAVSRVVADELPQMVLRQASAFEAEEPAPDGGGLAVAALRRALPAMDGVLRETGEGRAGHLPGCSGGTPVPAAVVNEFAFTGSTAIVALLECEGPPTDARPLRVVVANVGDSRAVLCRAGEAVALSEDQKPGCPEERERIEKAGGTVAVVGPCERIDGWGLNLSRALGDFHYKARDDLPPEAQKVSAFPEMMTMELSPEDEFLLLACDGVFELQTNQSAIDIVRNSLQSGRSATEAVEDLVDACCSPDLFETQGKGSDNVSALVVLLR